MPVVYVARSAALTKWASDVGQGKHIYKLGVAADEAAVKAAVAAGWGGESDWKLVQSKQVDDLDEDSALARLGRREKVIDPTYYPRLKGPGGGPGAAGRLGSPPPHTPPRSGARPASTA